MTRVRPPLPFALGLACFGLLGFFEGPLRDARPAAPGWRAGLQLVVSSEADAGPGTLREAILAADRSPQRARIDVRVATIRLESALPPLIGPQGVVIDASGSSAVIDGSRVAGGALLQIAAPRSAVGGIAVQGAVERGIAIEAEGVELREVTVSDCGTGVYVGAAGRDARIVGSHFTRNGTGVQVDPRASGSSVSDSVFRGHDRAAVWSVAAAPLLIGERRPLAVERNRFEDDRIAVVLVNVTGRVEGNHVLRPSEIGVLIRGDAVVRENRLEGPGALGIVANAPDGALVASNEVSGFGGIGVLVRDALRAEVRDNRVYSNAYGLASVFGEVGRALLADNLVMSQRQDGVLVLGGSPLLRGNRILRNQGAGLRLLDHVPSGDPRRRADPQLDANVIEANGSDQPLRGEYRDGGRR